MEQLSRAEFAIRFPLVIPGFRRGGIQDGLVLVERDTAVSGIINGDVVVRSGANALVNAIVDGSVIVEQESIVYLNGIIEKNIDVAGAVCIEGIVKGQVRCEPSAIVVLDGGIVTGGIHAAG